MAQQGAPQGPYRSWLDWVPIACFLLAISAVVIVYFSVPGTALDRLTVIVGYVILMLLFFFGLMVLFAMARGRIDLSLLLSEQGGGGASMSRFQLLIFTFVIAFCLFLITIKSMKFPAVPAEILTLLGISASTYAVSKGIQASSPTMTKNQAPQPPPPPAAQAPPPQAQAPQPPPPQPPPGQV
jgi:hypothetical protein